MNRRISIVAVVLIVAAVFTVRGVFSQPPPQAGRKVIKLAGGPGVSAIQRRHSCREHIVSCGTDWTGSENGKSTRED